MNKEEKNKYWPIYTDDYKIIWNNKEIANDIRQYVCIWNQTSETFYLFQLGLFGSIMSHVGYVKIEPSTCYFIMGVTSACGVSLSVDKEDKPVHVMKRLQLNILCYTDSKRTSTAMKHMGMLPIKSAYFKKDDLWNERDMSIYPGTCISFPTYMIPNIYYNSTFDTFETIKDRELKPPDQIQFSTFL